MVAEHQSFRAVVVVGCAAAVAAVLISGSHEISAERIIQNERDRLLDALYEVVDESSHDNDLLEDRIFVTDVDLLGTQDAIEVFRATLNGEPAGAIFASVAPRGYNGPIRLLVGIDASGEVTGVRVTEHRETPGLGDRIEIEKSDWISIFDQTSLNDPPLGEWAVVSDGGHFDALTGATVTPRAIVRAVRNTLTYYQQSRDEIFAQPAAAGVAP